MTAAEMRELADALDAAAAAHASQAAGLRREAERQEAEERRAAEMPTWLAVVLASSPAAAKQRGSA